MNVNKIVHQLVVIAACFPESQVDAVVSWQQVVFLDL